MLILLHVIIAITSVLHTTYLYFYPSKAKLYTAYAFVSLTLVSGTYLVLVTRTHILQACVSGLVYIGIISLGIVSARNKLTLATNKADN